MYTYKIEATITAAINYLENSISLSQKCNSEAATHTMWLASAEVEYAVFTLSLLQGAPTDESWKNNLSPNNKIIDFESHLFSAKRLLENAKTNAKKGKLENSYKEAWKARNLLLKAQELLDRKQKSKS